ncbi:MAG: dTDP-glucose 4,6-dehydratase [Fervidicoccaceae archaeon]
MKVLVTGGAGFIGSNFVRFLAKNTDIEMLVYDKLTYAGRYENIADLVERKRISFVKGDICDEEMMTRTMNSWRPDIVVNFAAETHVDRSINEPSPFIRTNILGIFTILEVLRKIDAGVLLHVSTDEVYGDLWGKEEKATENSILNPSSPYSASKASGDMLIKSYGRTYGLKYRIVRPCNNYGPYQHPEKLIPRTIIRLLHGRPAVIYGDGEQIRDWIFTEDTARAMLAVMERGKDGEIYNICSDMSATVKDIVEMILKIMGRDQRSIVYGKPRPGEDRRYAMECGKIKSLGWRPEITLEEGLRKTVKWYLDNEWWWKAIVDERYVLAESPWG